MIKKFWRYINNTPLNPILIILFSVIIGGILMVSLDDQGKGMEYFLSCIGLGISAAVVQCTLIQNQIQKDNIKIQLFNKRYSVFQSVLDTLTIIKRDECDRYILFNDNDINKQMILIEENLYKSVQLSVCLFDNELHAKLVAVNNAFSKIAKAYKNTQTANMMYLEEQENAKEYASTLVSHILPNKDLGAEEGDSDLKNKFPHIYANLTRFSKECDAYISLVEQSEIIKDFGKYIVVNKLDE